MAAGKFADSLSPSANRATPKPVALRASACPMAARLHSADGHRIAQARAGPVDQAAGEGHHQRVGQLEAKTIQP